MTTKKILFLLVSTFYLSAMDNDCNNDEKISKKLTLEYTMRSTKKPFSYVQIGNTLLPVHKYYFEKTKQTPQNPDIADKKPAQ